MDGWMEGCMDGWTDIDRYVHVHVCDYIYMAE